MISVGAGGNRRTEWSDPDFRDVATFVRDRVGLTFTGTRIESAEDAMRRVMGRFSIAAPVELRRRVHTVREIRDALLDELTVGESYFFREPRQLETVRRTLIELSNGPAIGRPLRLWSAGCAAGEEPYTLAIMLRESGIARAAHVLGTDVAVGRLAAARRGRYSRWALRGLSDERIAQYFEQQGNQFVLDPAVRRIVEFRPLNLVADEYPSPVSGVQDQDVILCRNVLIYMSPPTVTEIARRLLASLTPHGWLFLGASDPPLGSLVACEVISTAEGMAYRRPQRRAPRSITLGETTIGPPTDATARPGESNGTPRIEAEDAKPSERSALADRPNASLRAPETRLPDDAQQASLPERARVAYRAGDFETAASLARQTAGDEADSVTLVRALSNLGRIREAAEACAAALERHRDSAELNYLYALLLLQGGHYAAAAAAARRALYLDRSFVLAHLALGDAFARSGHRGRARRAFRNAIELLESAPGDAVVAGGDGESAARFLRISLDQLQALDSREATPPRTAR